MDVGGVQESQSWHCYRKKPLTPKKQVNTKERKEIHASQGIWEKLQSYQTIKSLYLLDQGKCILIKVNNPEQVTLAVPPFHHGKTEIIAPMDLSRKQSRLLKVKGSDTTLGFSPKNDPSVWPREMNYSSFIMSGKLEHKSEGKHSHRLQSSKNPFNGHLVQVQTCPSKNEDLKLEPYPKPHSPDLRPRACPFLPTQQPGSLLVLNIKKYPVKTLQVENVNNNYN